MQIKPFLKQFFEDVNFHLDDPQTSKRFSAEQKYNSFLSVERQLWERLARSTRNQGAIGIVETTFDTVVDQEYYKLPGNFRKFIALREISNNSTLATFHSRNRYSLDGDVQILPAQRLLRFRSLPKSVRTLTLEYEKGPIHLHYAEPQNLTTTSIVLGEPHPDAGIRVNLDDYYVGSTVRVIEDGHTAQTRDIVDSSKEGGLLFRFPLDYIPSKNVVYEIRPTIPPEYDDLYALDVALRRLAGRNMAEHRNELLKERSELWEACKAYFQSIALDRGPRIEDPQAQFSPDDGYESPFEGIC